MAYYDRTTWQCKGCLEEWFIIHGEVEDVQVALHELKTEHFLDHPECAKWNGGE